jgi:hypothetical protein
MVFIVERKNRQEGVCREQEEQKAEGKGIM